MTRQEALKYLNQLPISPGLKLAGAAAIMRVDETALDNAFTNGKAIVEAIQAGHPEVARERLVALGVPANLFDPILNKISESIKAQNATSGHQPRSR